MDLARHTRTAPRVRPTWTNEEVAAAISELTGGDMFDADMTVNAIVLGSSIKLAVSLKLANRRDGGLADIYAAEHAVSDYLKEFHHECR